MSETVMVKSYVAQLGIPNFVCKKLVYFKSLRKIPQLPFLKLLYPSKGDQAS
jgi:hypothetical protein